MKDSSNPYFRISIRESLLLIAAIAMGCGWYADASRVRRQAEWSEQAAERWKYAAGTLERIIENEGYAVTWGPWAQSVRVVCPKSLGVTKVYRRLTSVAPSEPDPKFDVVSDGKDKDGVLQYWK